MEKRPINEGVTRANIKGVAQDGMQKGMQKQPTASVKPPPPPPPVAKK
jgi:hypothetical protein